jgi:hypothetical protein
MRANLAFGTSEQTLPILQRNYLAINTPRGLAARPRPALTQLTNIGTSNIRGIFRKAGLFSGDLIVLADTTLYRVAPNGAQTAISGTIPADTRVSIDAGLDPVANEPVETVRIATGSALFKLQGSTLTQEDFPIVGGAGASDIAYLKGYWLASEAGTDQVYILIPGQTTWDALTFATAEYAADPIVGIWPLGDQAYFFGSSTTEVWYLTGDANAPIAPVQGLAMDVGCRARDTIAATADALFWVDDQCAVRMTLGGQADVVSDDWLQALIAEEDPMHLRAWACTWRQHPLYILSLPRNGTFVFDLSTRLWSEWTSKDKRFFRGHLGTECDAEVFAADAQGGTGIIWRFDDATSDGGDEIERLITAYQPQTEGRVSIGNAVLDCDLGRAPMTGQGSEPLVALRWSDDRGMSWSNWRFASLGTRGQYNIAPRWNRLGQVKGPFGRLWQARTSDPVMSTVYGLDLNV